MTLGWLAATAASAVSAQDRPPPQRPDSLVPTRLGDIVISAAAAEAPITTYTEKRISYAELRERDATVAADFGRLIPAAHIQTNSRGETLVYLRNAGERQVAVFFEGALLNVPWDNRVDMSLVPAAAIGGITVAKGVPPVEYGTNVVGGAVNLTAHAADGPWSETEASFRYGTGRRREGAIVHHGYAGGIEFTGAASYAARDGLPVAGGATLPYSQAPDALRTNTDSRVINLFAHGAHDIGGAAAVSVSLLHMDSEKGIAPEGHLDPATSQVRFWRYPEWRTTMAIASGVGSFGAVQWKGSAWMSVFAQRIDAFASDAYGVADERQEDDDLTFGARFITSVPAAMGSLKFSLNALTSTHEQVDMTLDDGEAPAVTPDALEYRQHTVSAGTEYARPIGDHTIATAGASFDAMYSPKTGDKPDQDPFTDYSANLGVIHDAGSGWSLRGALGRKTRFPTLRELFGAALNRFLINPDLKPESSILAEVGVSVAGERFSGEIIPFGTFTSNTIDQRSVTLPGETASRRQRINLAGSRVLGVELVGAAAVGRYVNVEGHLTLMDVHRTRDAPDDPTRLSEKPTVLGRLSVGYHAPSATSLILEGQYTAGAYSLDDDNAFVALDNSLSLNVRASQTVEIQDWRRVQVFVRAENLTDAVVLPQLGLPEPGRTVSGGVTVTF